MKTKKQKLIEKAKRKGNWAKALYLQKYWEKDAREDYERLKGLGAFEINLDDD